MALAEMSREEAPNALVTGPLRRTVFLLALPVLGEQLLNFLVGFYDVFLSGHLDPAIGTAATAAVGVAAYVGWLASMVFSLVATGTTALISRAWGSGDREQANIVANRSLLLGALTGLLFLILVVPLANPLVRLMGLTGISEQIAVRYVRLDAIGLWFAAISFVIAAALRGCGDMRTPLAIFGLVNVVNVIVSTWLVYGGGPVPALGVDGIVGGTIVARVTGGLLFLVFLLRGVKGLSLRLKELRLGGETVRRILRIGLPAAAEGIIMWVGHCIFLRVIADLGPAAFAAHIVGVRIEAITYLPAVAWGAAAATMVGQSLGADRRERAVQAGHEAARQCALFGVLITLWFTLGAEGIFRLMHQDPAVRAAGSFPFRIVGLFQLPLILSIVYFAALRGAGDTTFPLMVTSLTTYLIRIPIGYLCGVTLEMGLLGAWLGMNCDILIRGMLSTWRYWAGRWIHTKV